MKHVWKRWAVGLVALSMAAAPRARAAAHTYNTRTQTIRCGVLLPNTDSFSTNAGRFRSGFNFSEHAFSYVFQALNARSDVRPYSWDIINPHAAPFVDQVQANRYGLSNNPGTATYYNPNNPPHLNKNMGAYWEVFLHDATAEELSDYDVLYMPMPFLDNGGSDALTLQDREKLRSAVDGGAILWMDNNQQGANGNPVSGALSFVQPLFDSKAVGTQYENPLELPALLNAPNQLSAREVRRLGFPGLSRITNIAVDNVAAGPSAPFVAKPIVYSSQGGATVEVLPYGQGAVVITSTGIGQHLSRGFAPDPTRDFLYGQYNTGPVCGSDARFLPVSDLKFVVNLLAYRFQSPQTGQGPRHTGGSREDVASPLGRKWQYQVGFNKSAPVFVSDPVVWNGVTFAVTPDLYVRAFDMEPGRDLDGDGNPDDGIPDNGGGTADQIWRSQSPLTKAPSSLTVMEVNLGNRTELRLFGMLSDGSVFSFTALPRTVNLRKFDAINNTLTVRTVTGFGPYNAQLQNAPTAAGKLSSENDVYRVPAPVAYNGRLFVVGANANNRGPIAGYGALAEINPANLNVVWEAPASGANPNWEPLGYPSATPTIAAIPDKGYSGATDIFLIIPTFSQNGSGSTPQPSGISAFPLGVRGERLIYNTSATKPEYYTRFAGAYSLQTLPATIYKVVNTTVTQEPAKPVLSVLGTLKRLGVDGPTIGESTNLELRADYDFDIAKSLIATGDYALYHRRWFFPAPFDLAPNGGTPHVTEVLTSPVVSADGGIYYVASDFQTGQLPTIIGLQMRTPQLGFDPTLNPAFIAGINQPQLSFIYSVNNNGATNVINTATTQVTAVLGNPAVDRGALYVPTLTMEGSASADSSPASQGTVTGFYVQGSQFGLELSRNVDLTNGNGNIQIYMVNRFTGSVDSISNVQYDVSNISEGNVLHGLLTLRSLGGLNGRSLDLSRQGDIRVSYQTLDPSTGTQTPVSLETPTLYYKTARGQGTNSSNLIAFTASVPSARGGIRTGVSVAGGSIYVGADDGEIYTTPLPSDLSLASNAPAAPMRPATFPGLPASAGYSSYNNTGNPYPGGAELRATPVLSNGTLVANSPAGVFSFYAPRTLVTDAGRIVEVSADYTPVDTNKQAYTGAAGQVIGGFNPAGSAVLWSLDSTTQDTPFNTPGIGDAHSPYPATNQKLLAPIEKSLNQPTMAVRVNVTNTLICDTGNNRVVEVDHAGTVVWQCTDFADPTGLLGPNESHSLNGPTSVQRWESYDIDASGEFLGRTVHNLITDFGNNRILDIESRYSRPGTDNAAYNVLAWVGRGPEGRGYQFFQAQRLPYFSQGGSSDNDGKLDFGRTVASVVNYNVNSVDVQLDPSSSKLFTGEPVGLPPTPGGSLVILGGALDKAVGGAQGSASGKVVYFLNRVQYGGNGKVFPMSRPVYFNMTVLGPGEAAWRATMTDGQNIFDVARTNTTPGLASVITGGFQGPIIANQPIGAVSGGGLGSGGYTVGTAMARRLANGNVLIVNQKTGYVFEYSPTEAKAGGSPTEVLSFIAPPISGTGALVRPVFADRLF